MLALHYEAIYGSFDIILTYSCTSFCPMTFHKNQSISMPNFTEIGAAV